MVNKLILDRFLNKSKVGLVIWTFIAGFGTYFCMYAFRKPFNAGLYKGVELFGLDYKDVLIISQVIGYMSSKFIGIKVVSELNPKNRSWLILGFVSFALLMLLGFGLTPPPYNFPWLFFNGLPLGMIWGIVFSYLEGRKLTELLAVSLTTSAILSSGVLKSVGVYFTTFLNVSDYWMPFSVGLIFLIPTGFFVWMLTKIPPPTKEDIESRSVRAPMTKQDRLTVIRKYGFGIFLLILTYLILLACRDFRDNFMVEILLESGVSEYSTFTKIEFIITLIVTVCTGALVLIVNHNKAIIATYILFFLALVVSTIASLMFNYEMISAVTWMLFIGLGIYLAAVPFQVVIFERLVAFFKMKSNAGYLMYLADSTGYLVSVIVLLWKNIGFPAASITDFYKEATYGLFLIGMPALIGSFIYFQRKKKVKNEI